MEIYYEILRSYRAIEKQDDRFDFLSKVIQGLSDYPTIFTGLTHNAAGLGVINNAYLVKINAAKGGDITAIDDRDKYYDETWLPAVDLTAKEIEDNIADGDKVIIDKSGFKPTAGIKVRAQLPKQMHIEAKSTVVSQMDYNSDTKDVGKDVSYFLICSTRNVVSVTQDADGKLIIQTSGDATIIVAPIRNKKGTLKGMPSEQKMSVYAVASNAAGVGPLSAEAKVIIQ